MRRTICDRCKQDSSVVGDIRPIIGEVAALYPYIEICGNCMRVVESFCSVERSTRKEKSWQEQAKEWLLEKFSQRKGGIPSSFVVGKPWMGIRPNTWNDLLSCILYDEVMKEER